MNNADRRTFFKIAGVGAVAAAGTVAVLPGAAGAITGSAAPAHQPTAAAPAAAGEPMVAYVTDVSRGEVILMVEGRETTVTNHALVAAIATAVHSSHSSLV